MTVSNVFKNIKCVKSNQMNVSNAFKVAPVYGIIDDLMLATSICVDGL